MSALRGRIDAAHDTADIHGSAARAEARFQVEAWPGRQRMDLGRSVKQIDQAIALVLEGRPPAAQATASAFLQRVQRDLVGLIPTADAARDFLDDPSPGKRVRRIDQRLEGPRYARHMREVFGTTLRSR